MVVIAAIEKQTGLVKYTSIPSIFPTNLEDLETDELFFIVTDKTNLNYYYKNSEFKQLPEKPSRHHIWDLETEQWQEPEGYLQTIQTENTTQVNQLSSRKILPKYPIHLQLNLPYDFGQDSIEVQTMRTWIDSVRTLANTAKAEIALATTLEEITTIVDTFKQELAEFS